MSRTQSHDSSLLKPATLALERRSGLSCEIVRTYARIRSLTTGTFNRVVKDRIAIRLSGANSVQPESARVGPGLRPGRRAKLDNPTEQRPTVLETFTNIRCSEKPCQRQHPTEFPPLFHTGKMARERRFGELPTLSSFRSTRRTMASAAPCAVELKCAQQYGLPLGQERSNSARTPKRKTEN